MRQIWRCEKCGAERQWGTCSLPTAIHAAKESDEHVNLNPMLICDACGDYTPHTHARDFDMIGEEVRP